MTFFKDAQTYYNSTLDECGDIRKSLTHLKKKLVQARKPLPPARWARLSGALMSGEIQRGKKCTPGDWAAQEAKLLKEPSNWAGLVKPLDAGAQLEMLKTVCAYWLGLNRVPEPKRPSEEG